MSQEQMRLFQHMVEARLNTLFQDKNQYNTLLVDAMNYSLMAGGKRLRPTLVLATAAALGTAPEEALDTACAVECIHTYSLVHDDLPGMDDDALRRGKPTNHVVFGVGQAILAGDGLLTEAFEIIAASWLQKERGDLGLRLIHELAIGSGMRGMVVGQSQDLASENKRIDADTMHYIHAHKTGALITASCRIGALIGGADSTQLDHVTDYARNIGLAFQITDDILDVTGDEASLGKPVGSDEKNHKATYPSMYGLEESRQLAAQYCAEAQQALDNLPGDVSVLRYLADYILNREK